MMKKEKNQSVSGVSYYEATLAPATFPRLWHELTDVERAVLIAAGKRHGETPEQVEAEYRAEERRDLPKREVRRTAQGKLFIVEADR
jgi:hypothetical protein